MKLLLDVTARVERDHFWFRGLRRFVRPLLEQAQAGRPQMDILDCGCGTGTNLHVLSDYGRACGVDRELAGVRRASAAGQRFDLVTSFDVLYCLDGQDERAAVAEMFRVLRPGGRVIINVAAMPALTGNHSVLCREVRRYTAPTLRVLLEGAGFLVERLTYTNTTMLPILVPLRLAQRAVGLTSGEEAGHEMQVPPWPLNTALDCMLMVEAAVVRRVDLPCGSSLLAMARKPAVSAA